MELFCTLNECDFEQVPSGATQSITDWMKGFRSTILIERSFNDLRIGEEESRNKQLCRKQRWAQLIKSTLMADHDRRDVVPTDESDNVAPTSIPTGLFDVDSKVPPESEGGPWLGAHRRAPLASEPW